MGKHFIDPKSSEICPFFLVIRKLPFFAKAALCNVNALSSLSVCFGPQTLAADRSEHRQ
jgi:hypothetical protein